ncbi:hypothetical protein FGB62_8g331 [Gracilaria domingensis]|nr:hypothetical protein FGB62_8g331 [Gracilaria domingensis]
MAWVARKRTGKGREQLVKEIGGVCCRVVERESEGTGRMEHALERVQILEDDGRSTAAVYLSGCPVSLSRRPYGVPLPEGSFSDRAQGLFMPDVCANAGKGRSEARWDVHGKCSELFKRHVDLICDD